MYIHTEMRGVINQAPYTGLENHLAIMIKIIIKLKSPWCQGLY